SSKTRTTARAGIPSGTPRGTSGASARITPGHEAPRAREPAAVRVIRVSDDHGVHGLPGDMLAVAGGRERTEAEFRALFTAAGFGLSAVVPAGAPSIYSVIEGVPK